MHKKLESDLISLAHSVLQMKNKDNVFLLKEKSKEIYEKLSVLAFVEEYVNSTPNLKETKQELLDKVVEAFDKKETAAIEEAISEKEIEEHDDEKIVFNLIDEPKEIKEFSQEKAVEEIKQEIIVEEKVAKVIEQPFDELEEIMFSEEENSKELVSDVVKVEVSKTMSLEEELHDIISVDVMADLFEKAQPKSLNDKLVGDIQIGLNDRITFVKNLFNGEQENYNRVVSQLNTFKSEQEAKQFLNTMVKPDYNWSEQEELETRFLEIIERKFA